MTLEKLLYKIGEIAIAQDIINFSAGGTDIYALNTLTIKDWPVLFISPTGSHHIKENTTEFSLTFYYLDRLLEGNSNEIGILSVSIEQLKALLRIIATIDGVVDVEIEYDITNFTETEAMNDRVAGSYATVMIEVLNDTVCFTDESHPIPMYEYVDLGLPSGTLWATCNVGANSPEEYGNYYAWGETETKSNYTWDTYKFGTEYNLTKYNSEDGLTELLPEDDVVHIVMGGDWHIPTHDQVGELISRTRKEMVTINGVNGTQFTSLSDSSKSIFIPAAGDRRGNSVEGLGEEGYLWNSLLNTNSSSDMKSASTFIFYSSWSTNWLVRYYGLPVRGVIG